MNIFKIFLVQCAMSTLMAVGMDNKQVQRVTKFSDGKQVIHWQTVNSEPLIPSRPSKEIKKGKISINKLHPMHYRPKKLRYSYDNDTFTAKGLGLANEPYITSFLELELDNNNCFCVIPASKLLGNRNGSQIELEFTDYIARVTCTSTVTFNVPVDNNFMIEENVHDKNDFQIQFHQKMNDFKSKQFRRTLGGGTEEFLEQEVITPINQVNQSGYPIFTHGPNGCPDYKALQKLVINEKTKGDSTFNFVMKRQFLSGNKLR